jgi:hypothetical protein
MEDWREYLNEGLYIQEVPKSNLDDSLDNYSSIRSSIVFDMVYETDIKGKFAIPWDSLETEKKLVKYFNILYEGNKDEKNYAEKVIKNHYNELIAANPQLEDIKESKIFKGINFKYHILLGVLSGYNIDDINFFFHPTNSDSVDKRKEELQNEYGVGGGRSFGWVPSMETLDKIGLKLKELKESGRNMEELAKIFGRKNIRGAG